MSVDTEVLRRHTRGKSSGHAGKGLKFFESSVITRRKITPRWKTALIASVAVAVALAAWASGDLGPAVTMEGSGIPYILLFVALSVVIIILIVPYMEALADEMQRRGA